MKPLNCLPNSAWHTWQTAGAAWRATHSDATQDDIETAANVFAGEPGWPPAGYSARFRAFKEGVRHGQ